MASSTWPAAESTRWAWQKLRRAEWVGIAFPSAAQQTTFGDEKRKDWKCSMGEHPPDFSSVPRGTFCIREFIVAIIYLQLCTYNRSDIWKESGHPSENKEASAP